MSDIVQQLDEELAGIVAAVRRSLVQVRYRDRSLGAGTIWHADGLIITNAHVAQRGGLTVTLPDGRTVPTRLLARDPECDLAALSVEAHDLPATPLGDARALRPGDWVMALGHPWGALGAVTAGIVVGMGADWPEILPGRNDWLVASLHLRPGHSGGPLVDAQGKLVGINTLMNGPDAGVAIPVHVAARFLKDALDDERRRSQPEGHVQAAGDPGPAEYV
ncbi:S1C family serine protease [Aggregatilinea lenta]|uniref:S1C family serine protease n=1 Tax=Aggregatilinea lenta TaxID=913108 RepID=UPI000E5BCD26|nr:trypsin-like peptidase domain-containing protein [Aggregatilinea lenta]